MTARPGRGRPPVFTEHVQALLLDAVKTGLRLGDACKKVGVGPNVPSRHARTNPAFAAALADAKAQGKQARIEDLAHDEYRYNVHGCRCPKCCTAATKGRAGRRAEARDGAEDPSASAPVSPTSFLLPRLSSWTGRHAA
ncbi:hypothetical protein [Streptomyces sp. NPDC047981]|uniref:hypothetical protein n=1 Tax=Streptomyces sp. NPDC047981 TaxID=3154610 RepID=UPI0034199EA8